METDEGSHVPIGTIELFRSCPDTAKSEDFSYRHYRLLTPRLKKPMRSAGIVNLEPLTTW